MFKYTDTQLEQKVNSKIYSFYKTMKIIYKRYNAFYKKANLKN